MFAVVRALVCGGLLLGSALAQAEETAPSTPGAAKPVRVYMRAEGRPLTFSARAKTNRETPAWCVAPCNAELQPGDYELKLNGVVAADSMALRAPGTWHGEYHSREAGRAGGWLGLNVGGILGGVFITVAALGGPSWAYVAGGGSLAAGSVIFLLTYRADSASVSFTPGEPLDVRGMPAPENPRASSAEPGFPDRARVGSQSRGLGFRVAF